jgi:hypothetical protein
VSSVPVTFSVEEAQTKSRRCCGEWTDKQNVLSTDMSTS